MISIVEAISDLLFVRDTVVVPGLGAFVKSPCSAKVDLDSNGFSMPSTQISFDPSLREYNDVIIKYLINEIGISENEAKRMLFHFVSDCFNTMKSDQKVQLKDIGTLSFGPGNEMVFEQESAVNYNTDAFGLSNFSLEPVTPPVVVENVEAEKEEFEQKQQDMVSPPTDDEELEPIGEGEREIGKGVWPFLICLVLIMSGLLYFKVYRPAIFGEKENIAEVTDESTDGRTIDEEAIKEMVGEMIGQIIREEMATPPVRQISKDTIQIIAGCYDREEPAQRMVNSLKNKGFVNAFMEKRGERWFVAYDRYHTEEEAHVALREIREVHGGKGWILK